AHAVLAGAVEGDAGRPHAVQRVGQRRTGGVEDGEVVEAGAAGRWRAAAGAFPRVETDVVVIAACGHERGLVAVALHQLAAENAARERERPVEVGDLEMDVADTSTLGDGPRRMVVWERCEARDEASGHGTSLAWRPPTASRNSVRS